MAGDPLAYSFTLVNQGARPLSIRRVEKSYSCTAEAPAQPLAPQASWSLRVSCNTRDRLGLMNDVVLVYSDVPQAPPLRLTLKAQIAPLLAFETTLVELESEFGQAKATDVRLVGKLAASAKLSVLAVDEGGPQVGLLAAEDHRAQGLRLQSLAKVVGTHVGRVLVATGVADPARLSLPYSCRVKGFLTLNPTNPFFNLGQAGGSEILLTVTSTRSDFKLHHVRVMDGPFASTFEPLEASKGKARVAGYKVRIRVVLDAIPPHVRGVAGKLALISNDPAEPKRELPLFALGAVPGRP